MPGNPTIAPPREGEFEAPVPATRVVAWNTAWRSVAFGARTVGGVVATVLVARTEGPSLFGRFQFVLLLTTLLSFVVTLGLPKLIVREVARRPGEGRAWMESGIFATLVAGALLTSVVAVVAELLDASGGLPFLLLMGGLAVTLDSAARVMLALFWAFERMRLEAITVGIQEASFIAGTVGALLGGLHVQGVMVAYVASRGIGALVSWVIASRVLGSPVVPRPDGSFLRSSLRRAFPFAADDALSLAYIRVDAVLLFFMKGARAVGFYQAGTNLVLYLNVLPRMLNLSLYPRMSRAWPDRPQALARLRDVSLRLLGAIAMPITVGSLLLAPRVFELVYGRGFQRAVVCYQVLVPVIPIRMLGNTLGTTLTAVNGQTRRTVAVAIAAVVNIALNLALIPPWSYLGAAVATLITETGLFVAYLVLVRRAAGPSEVASAIGLPALACLPLAGAVILAWGAPLPVTIAAGGIAYIVALALATMATRPHKGRSPKAVVLAYFKASA